MAICPIAPLICPPGQSSVFVGGCTQKCVPDKVGPVTDPIDPIASKAIICPIPPLLCPPGQSSVFIGRGCNQKCVPDNVDPVPVPVAPDTPPIVAEPGADQ